MSLQKCLISSYMIILKSKVETDMIKHIHVHVGLFILIIHYLSFIANMWALLWYSTRSNQYMYRVFCLTWNYIWEVFTLHNFLAHQNKVGRSLCYIPGVSLGIRTWFKLQVLYLSYIKLVLSSQNLLGWCILTYLWT